MVIKLGLINLKMFSQQNIDGKKTKGFDAVSENFSKIIEKVWEHGFNYNLRCLLLGFGYK